MSEKKNFCPTHHLYYKGNVCPLCEKERIDHMAKKFGKKEMQAIVGDDFTKNEKKYRKEITESDLERLVQKFNTIR